MHARRLFWILVVFLVSGSFSSSIAAPISILSKNFFAWVYAFQGEGPDGFSAESQSSSDHGVSASSGGAIASADGLIGPFSGSLGVVARGTAGSDFFLGASASATMDFRTTGTTDTILNLSTSGYYVESAWVDIGLLNLTDNVALLEYMGTEIGGPFDLTGFFMFSLEPSKNYRLQVFGLGTQDPGAGTVDYALAGVPEPSSLVILLPSLAVLGILRKKLRKEGRLPA